MHYISMNSEGFKMCHDYALSHCKLTINENMVLSLPLRHWRNGSSNGVNTCQEFSAKSKVLIVWLIYTCLMNGCRIFGPRFSCQVEMFKCQISTKCVKSHITCSKLLIIDSLTIKPFSQGKKRVIFLHEYCTKSSQSAIMRSKSYTNVDTH